ncbi:VCBS repeat-containing protein [Maribius pontilimi]|uniref:VCBS repeat-containing protein n=1 Tax=Palleronia pontilimi TaxID=1964209 RepID=A0A934IG24_9RHOB|nr:VCBS repeat-containing protein [Palleronia pontilimi]MBJ3761204.1 VCBS repeat-containing protein [Palleronia pontilimi]
MLRAALVFLLTATAAQSEGIARATYAEPTTRYAHGVLGDAVEWGALQLTTDAGRRLTIRLPATRVFEDLAPRLVDLDRDGANEVLTIETDVNLGARLSVYGADGLVASNGFIGRANRWLAPLGAADLDGDGRIEIASVDRPHLAKTLMIWRQDGPRLVRVAQLEGVTNHRIGDDYISGGIAACGAMVVADAVWSRALAVTWDGTDFATRDLGPIRNRASLDPARAC